MANDWNDRGVEVQNRRLIVLRFRVRVVNARTASGRPSSSFLRVEITENGASDHYTFFYRQNEVDPWTELTQLNSSQDNARAALFFKTGPSTAAQDRSVSFTHFNVGIVPEPSTALFCALIAKQRLIAPPRRANR
ncbi:MAG: hypothetical protein R3F11_10630 [Verrucomicrobiales bacterium]